jgi:hypothetical protein
MPGCGAVVGLSPAPLSRAPILRPPLPLDPASSRLLRAIGIDLPTQADEVKLYFHSGDASDVTCLVRGRSRLTESNLVSVPKARHPVWQCPPAVYLGLHGPNLFIAGRSERVEAGLDHSSGAEPARPHPDLWEAFARASRNKALWVALAPKSLGRPAMKDIEPGLRPAVSAIFADARAVSAHAEVGDVLTAEATLSCHDEAGAARLLKVLQAYQWAARWGEAAVPKSEYLKRLWGKAITSARMSRAGSVVTVRTEVRPAMLAGK